MDMINLREAPMVDKPEDGATLFALNEDGTINRIKADGIGGGKIAKLHAVTDESTEPAPSLQNLKDGVSTASNMSYAATCDNMTYEEAVEVIQSGEPLGIYLTVSQDGQVLTDYSASYWYTGSSIVILFVALMAEFGGTWYWTADGISTAWPGQDS